MIQLVHFENGINVINSAGVENPEFLFCFDMDNNYLQNFTYPDNIQFVEMLTMLDNTKHTIVIEEDSFLYYSLWTQVAFSHYMAQTLPKLLYYDRNDLLIIPKSTYTILCKEILKTLGIKEERIFLLEDNVKYVFKNLKTSHHLYHGPGGEIFQDMFTICRLLRDNLNITVNSNPYRKVYLKRDGTSNKDFGNGELGHHRRITNESDIISYLESLGFEIIHLGDKLFDEKVELLKDINILITPLGANCMNLIFSNCPKNILMLSNDRPIGPEYFINLCTTLNNSGTNAKIFTYPSINYCEDPKNDTNSPFTVNINDVINYIKSL